jgi:uncharacterized protein
VRGRASSWTVALLAAAAVDHLYRARITGVEVIDAMCRGARHGNTAAPDVAAALTQFRQAFTGLYRIIEITPTPVTRAMALAETYVSRGYEAVRLAATVEVYIRGETLGLPALALISADKELNMAATAEGLTVENPHIH